MFLRLLLATVLISGINQNGAQAGEYGEFRRFGEYDRRAIILEGEIAVASYKHFQEILDAFPEVKFLALNSPGGSVGSALKIAKLVEERGLTTLVTDGHTCFSACSFIFLAGNARYVKGGQLGVHQFSGSGHESLTQEAVAEIYDALLGFGITEHVMSHMFRTPNHEMYIFSEDELVAYEINRHSKPIPALKPEGQVPVVEGRDDHEETSVELFPVSTKSFGVWTAGTYYSQSPMNMFCAVETRQQNVSLRVVRYLFHQDYFLEIVNMPFELEYGQVEIVFGVEFTGADESLMTLRTEYTAWGRDVSTDISSARDEEALLSILSRGRELTVRRIDGEFIGSFSLMGSAAAIDSFKKCIAGEEDYQQQVRP